jgi:hypothetical protein
MPWPKIERPQGFVTVLEDAPDNNAHSLLDSVHVPQIGRRDLGAR